jgi:hypothetical protein
MPDDPIPNTTAICPHGCHINLADRLAHVREANRLRPIHHYLRCFPQPILSAGRKVNPHTDADAKLRGDRQYRCIGKLSEQVGANHDSGPRLIAR